MRNPGDPWTVRAGRWLTKRRGILLAPLFVVALIASRPAARPWVELAQWVAGLSVTLAGTWLRLLAASYHEGVHSSEPITAGPYGWVRHPLYLANFLLGLGIMLAAGCWPLVVLYTLLFLPVHAVIARAEEVHLTRLYGEAYGAYRRSVPALLPYRRYRGRRYGSRSDFKLREGKERVKTLGYFLGLALLFFFKRWHLAAVLPALRPLSAASGAAAMIVAALAVVFRPRIRWAWVRGCQTVVAVGCVILLAVHLPGVWTVRAPADARPAAVAGADGSATTRPSPPRLSARESGRGSARRLALAEAPPRASAQPALPSASLRPRGFWNGVGDFLWGNLDVIGGAAAFGMASLVEDEREEHKGSHFEAGRDLEETGPIALGVAVALGLWKQWRREDPWRVHLRPVAGRDEMALLAVVKRRF